jgi:hypothetical protein
MLKWHAGYGLIVMCDGCGKCERLDIWERIYTKLSIRQQILNLLWTIDEHPSLWMDSALDIESFCYCPDCSVIKDIIE